MKKLTIEVSGEIEVQYDEQSPEFQASLLSYNEFICDATPEQMVRNVVSQMQSWGDHYRMVEGVGYIGLIDGEVPKEDYAGIQISNNYADLHYEIQ